MPGSADPAVLPTSPTQDGQITPPSEPAQQRSIVGGAGDQPAANPDQVSQTMADKAAEGAPPAGDTPPPEPAVIELLTWDQVTDIPEGLVVPEEVQTELLGLLNNRELTPAQLASQSIQLHARMMESAAAEMAREWEETQTSWRDQIRQMPEMQGGRYEENLAEIARVLNRYGSPEARKAFDLTGAGNHPAVVQFLLKIAKDINEEEPISGDPPAQTIISRDQRMYGNKGA